MILTAEWLKLRSLRTSWALVGLVALAIAAGAGLSWSGANAYDHMGPGGRMSMASVAQLVGMFTELLTAILGALAITAEYRTGTMTTSAIAVPRRWPMLAAKGAVVAAVTLVVGEAAVFAGYLESHAIVGDRPILLDAGPFRDHAWLLIAQGLLPMLFALVGLGLGTILRSTAATITCVVLLWYPVPIIANQLPSPWRERITSVVPDALPGQVSNTGNAHSIFGTALPPWAAALAMALYIVVPLAIAIAVLRRRDVG